MRRNLDALSRLEGFTGFAELAVWLAAELDETRASHTELSRRLDGLAALLFRLNQGDDDPGVPF